MRKKIPRGDTENWSAEPQLQPNGNPLRGDSRFEQIAALETVRFSKSRQPISFHQSNTGRTVLSGNDRGIGGCRKRYNHG